MTGPQITGADLHHHLLTAPHGTPGSARARYGAAMALHHAGALTDTQLEAYREAQAFDTQDPAQVLADRGLPPPLVATLPGETLLHLLLVECDRLLSTTPGDGVAEVRRGLSPAFTQTPHPATAPANAVLSGHLPAALAAVQAADPALAHAIAGAVPHLPWVTYDAYDPARIGPWFPRAHAFASLIGGDAPYATCGFDFGLFLVAPGTLYRDHAHPAPELYLPLTGPHQWRFAPGAGFAARPAFTPVWNPPHRPHATLTGAVPFLALFGWTADVDAPAYVLDAPDWPQYEPAP